MRKVYYQFLNFFSEIYIYFSRYRLRVLAYHDIVDQNQFENQIQYLKTKFNIISIEDLKDHLFKKKQLPKKPVLITFDDGDLSVLEFGLPVLKRKNVPACLFIITNLINSNKPFWWNEILYYIGNIEGNKKVWEVKSWPNNKREIFLRDLRNKSVKPKKISSQLTLSDLEELKTGGVFIANHTHTHPMLDMSSKDEVQNEFDESKNLFKEWNINGFDVFAYPNGNFDKFSERLLVKNKIQIAFLFDHKINNRNIDPLRISRIRINSDTEINEFKTKIAGVHSFVFKLTK